MYYHVTNGGEKKIHIIERTYIYVIFIYIIYIMLCIYYNLYNIIYNIMYII